jgi:hypothetical protein
MLTAMLDATGRIAAVARQASDLALWHESQPPGDPRPVALGELVQRVAASELPRPVAGHVPADLATVPVSTWQIETLCAAVSAIALAVERNHPDQPIGVRAVRSDGEEVALLVGVETALAAAAGVPPASDESGPARDRLLGGGGQGLSLILAASVLDRHGISVGLIESSGIVVLRLPKDRGHQ